MSHTKIAFKNMLCIKFSFSEKATKICAVFLMVLMLKLRYYEKATKFEKNLPPVLTKQLFLLSSVETSGRFFLIFVAFSEKLDFKLCSNMAFLSVVLLDEGKVQIL